MVGQRTALYGLLTLRTVPGMVVRQFNSTYMNTLWENPVTKGYIPNYICCPDSSKIPRQNLKHLWQQLLHICLDLFIPNIDII